MNTKKVYLMIIFLLALCSMQVFGVEKSVLLYTPYTQVSVPPGQSIDYSVDMVNNTDQMRKAPITIIGMPRGWKYELKAGGWTVKQLAVLPKDKKTLTLTVNVPMQVNKGTYHFTVLAAGLAQLPLSVTVSEQGTYQTEFTTKQPNMQGNSKAAFNFNAILKNETGEQQLYALIANAPRGWNIVFRVDGKQATSAQVDPNATESIGIDITPPSSIAAGDYKIPVHASTSTTSADLTLDVVVTGSYEIELTTPDGRVSADITAGDTKHIDLLVRNTGTAELKDVKLTSNKPADWEITFEPSTISKLTAGSATNIVATVKASKKALPGDYVTKMTASTPEVTNTAEFRMSVHTSLIYGWLGFVIIIGVLGGVYYLFRKYGRR